jgi:hypothetical protein
MRYEIHRLELNEHGDVIRRTRLHPLFEARDHAMKIAEFEAGHCWGEYDYDAEWDCWWATDERGRRFRFEVEAVAELAA